MRVLRLSTLEELAPYADAWDRLARGIPFRGWTWMSAWWRHYGDGPEGRGRLFVLCAFEGANTLVGLAPWYLDVSAAQGRVLRFLGSGEVCSDHLSVLCQPGLEDRVTEAMARWLSGRRPPAGGPFSGREADEWDLLELSGVDADDPAVGRLADHLAAAGNGVHRLAGPNGWRIELPDCWEDYLAILSRPHANKLRHAQRLLVDTGRAVLHTVQRLEELPRAVEILIDLHQRRWRSRGQTGCFRSSRFEGFHRDVMRGLLLAGQLQLHWIELDGRPVAAEYQLASGGVVYAYQSGIEPEALACAPGRLAHLTTIRRAIRQGYRAFDFLRGDEPYKAHLRARPHPMLRLRVVPPRVGAQLRHGVWAAGRNVKQWIKRGLRMVGARG
jgi:CelD/BcsL family acetyltransferase involved in cellulose biosynthesis